MSSSIIFKSSIDQMGKRRVLMLVHPRCVPPKNATVAQAEWAIWKTEFHVKKALIKLGANPIVQGVSESLDELKAAIEIHDPHVVFNLLEQFQGEPSFESHVVSVLELMGVTYTGCNPQGLAIARDKALSKKILKFHNIPTPEFFVAPRRKRWQLPVSRPYPMIVKSINEEASMGISQDSVVTNDKDLIKRVEFIHDHIGTDAIVEQYIDGREFYIGVMGNESLKVLPPWELHFGDLSKNGFPIATWNVKFSEKYSAKHGITRRAPTDLGPFVVRKMENLSRSAYQALKLSGYARLDVRLNQSGEVYFIEANPNAELAKGECMANAALQAGLSYEELIRKIIGLASAYRAVA